MKVHPVDMRNGVNKGDITNSREFLSEFLVNSLGTYQRAMQLGMEQLDAGEVTKEQLLKEIKIDMKNLLSGMLQDVPENSPNREKIEQTAKIIRSTNPKHNKIIQTFTIKFYQH